MLLLAGFATSLSLIVAIGAQNAFVLRQGLRREHVLPVVLTCALSDALLISGGIAASAPFSRGANLPSMWRSTAAPPSSTCTPPSL